MRIAGIILLVLATGCTTTVYTRSGTYPAEKQADLLACEAQALKLFPVSMQPRTTIGIGGTIGPRVCHGWLCTGTGIGVYQTAPVSTYDANATRRTQAVENCMATSNYRRTSLARCTPEQIAAGVTYPKGAPDADACAVLVDGGGWVAVNP